MTIQRVSYAIAFICSLLLAATALGQDKKAPEKGEEVLKRILENDRVNVTEATYKPGAASAMRERPERVSRALTAGTMEVTWANGKKETRTWTAGEVRYLPRETFSQKNVGKTDMTIFSVGLKDTAKASAPK